MPHTEEGISPTQPAPNPDCVRVFKAWHNTLWRHWDQLQPPVSLAISRGSCSAHYCAVRVLWMEVFNTVYITFSYLL